MVTLQLLNNVKICKQWHDLALKQSQNYTNYNKNATIFAINIKKPKNGISLFFQKKIPLWPVFQP